MFIKKNPLQGIPGPRGLPLIGNMLQIDLKNMQVYLSNLAKKHGSIYGLSLLGTPVVVVNSKEGIYQVLVKQGREFGGRYQSSAFKLVSEDCNFIAASDPTYAWNTHKKLIFKHIHAYGSGLQKIEELVVDVLDDSFAQLKEDLATNQKPRDFDESVKDIVTTLTFMVVFNHRPEQKDIKNIAEFNTKTLNLIRPGGPLEWLDFFPWLQFFRLPVLVELENVKKLRWETYDFWKNRLMNQRKDNTDLSANLLHSLLEKMEGENAEQLTDQYIHCIIWHFFSAGIVTTTETLRCLINVLIHYPNVQKRLSEESQSVIGERTPSLQDKENLPYNYATILETVR